MKDTDYSMWADIANKAAEVKVKPTAVAADDAELQEIAIKIEKRNKEFELETEYYFGRPKIGKILILPRSSAQQFIWDKPWACISIASEKDELPTINSAKRVGLLKMVFADVDMPRDDFEGYLFSDEQADEIIQFAKKVWNKIDLLMIHCYAGLSRSPAVGKAISDVYQAEYSKWFDAFYDPNKLVYKTIKQKQSE